MSKDCPNCPAFGKHCPHKVNGDPYFYDCYLTVAELEKENAELKRQLNKNPCVRKDYYCSDCLKDIDKAKEILAKLLEEEKNNMYWEMNGSDKSSYYEVRKQAEQFLSEVEK